jgi:hypothetical protein
LRLEMEIDEVRPGAVFVDAEVMPPRIVRVVS